MTEILFYIAAAYVLVLIARIAWNMLPFVLIAALLFACSGSDHRAAAPGVMSASTEGGI